MIEADYLIIGAGFAGSVLGYLLRRCGARVLCLELRDARTKDKLCAGMMSDGTLDAIGEVFGEDAPMRVGVSERIPWLYRCLGRERTFGVACRIVPRKLLDDLSLARFVEADGIVHDRARVVSVDEEARQAQCLDLRMREAFVVHYGELIGADGALSSVRKLLTGRCGRTVTSLQGTVPALPTKAIIASLELGVLGYCWHAPCGSEATVGCYHPGLGVQESRGLLENFCGELGIEVPPLRGASIPTGDDCLLRAGEHVWLVGDAAGLVNAMSGGGIHFALESARLLAASFVDGASYEEAMAPTIKTLDAIAGKLDDTYRQISLKTVLVGSGVS